MSCSQWDLQIVPPTRLLMSAGYPPLPPFPHLLVYKQMICPRIGARKVPLYLVEEKDGIISIRPSPSKQP